MGSALDREGPSTTGVAMDPQILVDAFHDAKLIGKDETLRLVERASRSAEGWAITIDLPATRKATAPGDGLARFQHHPR